MIFNRVVRLTIVQMSIIRNHHVVVAVFGVVISNKFLSITYID
jgi:hypothetical protein